MACGAGVDDGIPTLIITILESVIRHRIDLKRLKGASENHSHARREIRPAIIELKASHGRFFLFWIPRPTTKKGRACNLVLSVWYRVFEEEKKARNSSVRSRCR